MIDDKYKGMAESLRSQLAEGAESTKTVATQSSKTQAEPQTENQPQNGATKMETVTNSTTSSSSVTLQAVVQAGDHIGRTFELRLTRKGAPCWIGRSQGKKFRHNGISLPKDLEVSTTHGKIELRDGIVQFTDTGSTNGSKVDGKDVEADDAISLTTGTLLTVGQTQMEIRLL
jgi:predicted component of type VI protein secretion system